MKQKNSVPLRRRNLVLAVSAALATLAAAPAFADPMLTIKLFRDSEIMFRDADMSRWSDNYVELGAGYNSKNSLRFGQFSGLTDKGGFPLAGFNWVTRDQSNDAQYWQIHGANLGLDSRKFKAEGGVQGLWDASFSFDGLKKSQTESARFIHQGLGSNSLTLPGAWAAVTPASATLPPLLRPFEIQHSRDIYRLGLKGLLGNEWDYKVNYREDRRDGTRMTGMSFSVGGFAAIVPYQIDDKTQQIEAVLSYTSKIAQFQLGYSYSKFSNSLDAFNVQNPYTAAGTNSAGRMSLAPDNDHHQINASGAYNFSKATRLSTTFSYGIARQNEAFLPYSTNVTGATSVLPRSSLDGKVVNTLLDVALTTKPIDKMNLKLGYQYRDSDNKTPIAQYRYASRDAAAVGAATSNSVRTNAPVSTSEQKLSLEGDYEIAPKTVLRAGFEHSDKKYTLTDRTNTQTDKLSIELRRSISAEFLGSLGYIHTERRGSDYDKNVYFRNTYTGTNYLTTISTTNGGLTNNPSMRQFMYADFNEDRLRTTGSWTVSETVSLQGVIDAYQQKMLGPNCGQFSDPLQAMAITGPLSSTCLGRDRAEGGSLSLDLQYQPEENLTTFAFANFSQTGIKQTGRAWVRTDNSGGADTRNFYENMIARDHTLGLGLKWQPQEKWDLGGTYVYNLGIGKNMVDQAASAATAAAAAIVASQPLPDTWNKLHSLQLFAKWDYSKELSWRFNYVYENLRSYDWATSDVPATGNANVLFTGQQAPRYSNHVFGVSAVVKSW
jgi:MtrB/PioB family decaheme-associated outer membrane protein